MEMHQVISLLNFLSILRHQTVFLKKYKDFLPRFGRHVLFPRHGALKVNRFIEGISKGSEMILLRTEAFKLD